MRNLTLAVITTLVPLIGALPAEARGGRAGGSVSVRGYVTSRGTYVAPHTRTAPDGIRENNLSYRGEITPRAIPASYGGSVAEPAQVAVAGPVPRGPVAARAFCTDGRVVSGFCVLN